MFSLKCVEKETKRVLKFVKTFQILISHEAVCSQVTNLYTIVSERKYLAMISGFYYFISRLHVIHSEIFIDEAAGWLSSGLGVDCSSNVRQCHTGLSPGAFEKP